jgi:hypothetical protein
MHPALKTPFLKTIVYIFKVFAGAGAFFKKLPAKSRCLREVFACEEPLPAGRYVAFRGNIILIHH